MLPDVFSDLFYTRLNNFSLLFYIKFCLNIQKFKKKEFMCYFLKNGLQSSLSIHGELVPRSFMDGKIHGCLYPTVGLPISISVKSTDTEGWLYAFYTESFLNKVDSAGRIVVGHISLKDSSGTMELKQKGRGCELPLDYL